jgi:hypothetical protein
MKRRASMTSQLERFNKTGLALTPSKMRQILPSPSRLSKEQPLAERMSF